MHARLCIASSRPARWYVPQSLVPEMKHAGTSIVRPENIPSQRVAQKIGLSLERTIFKNGGDALLFGAHLQP